MKSLNKKLYLVISVCLLVLCFSLSALATGVDNTSSTTSTSSQETVTTSSSTPSETESSDTEGSSSNVDGENSSDLSSDLEDENESGDLSSAESDLSGSSEITSGDEDESDSEDTSSSKTSSKKPSYGNIGGYVDDEADTSGWGDGEDEDSSQLVSAGTTEKKDNKNITDYTSLLWILIWIPILLILGSVGALVFVNRKAFVEAEELYSDTDDLNPPKRKKLSATEKAKRKNNHKNRTNVYKPRD
ncbi:MAG: hypothetical protein E7551_02160 [Ruminococcaceae bacterium]|nr:hypothetical protein [Oscillospiraceae bacterium]